MRMFLAMTVCLLLLTCGCDKSHPKGAAANQTNSPTASVPASAPASIPASQPGRVTIDQSSVKALLLTYHQSVMMQDWETQVQIDDPRVKPLMESDLQMYKCLVGINFLLKRKIGDPGKMVKQHPVLQFDWLSDEDKEVSTYLSGAMVGGKVDWSKVSIHEHGDSADIVFAEHREYTFKAKKIGGKWFGPIPPDWSDPSPVYYLDDKTLARFLDLNHQRLTALKFYRREIEAGLNDGTITKDNFGKKIAELDWLWSFQDKEQAITVLPGSTLFDLLSDVPETAAAGDSPRVIAAVAGALSEMMIPEEEYADQAMTRLACQFLGRHPNRQSIPVLLQAMDRTFVDPYCHDPKTNVVRYEAVWLDADDALRKITKASPVEQPSRQVKPTEPTRIKVRQAWVKWWEANRVTSAPAGR